MGALANFLYHYIFQLDEYNFKDVVFIKIDVEGHERQVIEGAKETILREKPVMLIEIEQRHLGDLYMSVIFDEIENLGYQGLFLHRGQFVPLQDFLFEKYQKSFLSNVSHSEYINNFFFFPVRNFSQNAEHKTRQVI